MAALINKTTSRVTRFFHRVTKSGQPRWYDCDTSSRGM
jgi:hypothetical protein